MAELELEVWVDQPSTGERMSGRNNDTENRLTPLHRVQWVTGTQWLHRRTCVNASFSHSLLTTDANEVTDYGLQVFTLDSPGELTPNHDTLFPDAVNCLHACMHAILYYIMYLVVVLVCCFRMTCTCLSTGPVKWSGSCRHTTETRLTCLE